EGLSGFEQLTGVPGTIGGALHHNAGTRGGEIGQFTKSATVMKRTGEIVTREGNDLRFSYRQSSLNELVILDAEFELESEDTVELTKRMQKLWILRRASQPARDQNMGCIFKNPGGLDAGDVIEQAGLKGARVGDAALNDKHGNYIIAHPGSRSEDILRLIELIRSGVSDRVGIDLELAIDLW
ncbi:MAG: UDP-N-acetylmuramate dehydrogenase, partial [Pirellulaceae bacterium]